MTLVFSKVKYKGDNLIELEGTAEQAYCLPMLPFMFFGGEFRLDPEGKVIEPCSRIQIGGVTGEEKGHVVYGGWDSVLPTPVGPVNSRQATGRL